MTDAALQRIIHDSPLGPIALEAGPFGLTALRFDDEAAEAGAAGTASPALARAAAQLDEYFAGRRTAFDLPLDLRGGPLEMRVWSELRRIPHGTTVSYGQLAEAVGRSDAVRAVAGAVARTPIPVVIPCHRVIGADGALRGYVGGLDRKAALLAAEGAAAVAAAPAPQLELL
jgi:methylated-DNA-[protein]-cysteine S-methyltransferase